MNKKGQVPASGPDTVGGFELIRAIGHGGMGVVYEAKGPGGELAAVKLLHTAHVNDELRRRFEREAAIRVGHPNVVKVLAAGSKEDGTPYIVFELLEGISLRDELKKGPMTVARAVDVGIQAARGLAAVHAHGVIHRDLKPGNLFVCQDGTIKLLDFGVALMALEEDRVTQGERRAIGTPSFLAPEQAQGDPNVDGRADLWALGVVLFEALSGVRPFKKETALATMLAVVVEDPPVLSRVAPHVPGALAAIVHRCIQKPRTSRFDSADDLLHALEDIQVETQVGEAVAPARPAAPVAPGGDLFGPTKTALPTVTGSLIDEKRVVSIILATGVRDMVAIQRAISAQGGLLVPILGRAIGLFGGEAWEGDEMIRAAAAALEIRAFANRVAVASGRASLSGQGISGSVVRRAERGCEENIEGVAVDLETARLLETGFSLRPIREEVFELTAERKPVWPLARGATSLVPPTVGRDVEVAQFRRIAEEVLEEEQGRALLALGPPGIGKSRLLRQLEQLLEDAERDVVVLSARADPLRRTASTSLLASALEGRARLNHMLRGGPRIDPSAPVDERREAVRMLAREAMDHPDDAAECADFLGELLAVPMPESAALRAARADGRLMADRLQLAVHDYFTGLLEKNAVALLVDDLQWADQPSLDLIEMLLDQLTDTPFLVAATARPELARKRLDLFAGRDAVRLDVRGLSMSDVTVLVESIAEREIDAGLVKAVFERSGGNPLFVEQIVRELKDAGRLDEAPEDLPLPLTVEAAVQSRLDHLAPEEKELCKRAAIFERAFTTDEVEALGVTGADTLLGKLRRRDLVASRARSRERRSREYRFRSPLMAEVAYRMITDEQLKELHEKAALILDGRDDVGPEEVATHYERGGHPSRAARLYADATTLAAGRFDTVGALRSSERALALGAPREALFDLHMARAEAFRFLGQHDAQHKELAEAEACASVDGELARVLSELSSWMSRRGMAEEATDTAARAVATARASVDEGVLALALARYASAQLYAGLLTEASASLGEASEIAERSVHKLRPLVADLRAQLASAVGDLGERRDAFAEAARLYRESGDLRRAANAELNLADAANRVGGYQEAATALGAALEKCRRVGNRLGEGYALLNLAYAQTMLGELGAAVSSLEGAHALAEQTHDARLAVAVQLYRARAEMRRDATLADLDLAKTAVDAEAVGMPGMAVLARTLAAHAALSSNDVSGALSLSERAMETRRQLGGVEEDEAEIFLMRSRALLAAGRNAEAKAVLVEGRARLEEVASKIGDPEWRRRFLKDVVAHSELMAEGADL